MELRFAGRGDMREMRDAIQHYKVTFGVQTKGGTAHFGDAAGRLDLATSVVTSVTATTIAENGPTLEV